MHEKSDKLSLIKLNFIQNTSFSDEQIRLTGCHF